MLITDSLSLYEFCDELRGSPYITVDTEFLRERTYDAQLCLVQVGYGDHAAAIDPLAKGLDLTPLRDLLLDKSIIKVLHAASQDMEIFLRVLGELPSPVFDTQIAAAVCDLGEQPGYAKLVQALLGIQIDKSSQATDWSLRPLTDKQIDYAIGDVTHLCKVYELLLERLEETGRSSWIQSDMAALLDETKYVTNPETAYKRIRIRRPKRKHLAVLRELAAWREHTAKRRNLPRPWVIRDEALVEIAQNQPVDQRELSRVKKLKVSNSDGEDLLDAVQRGLDSPEEGWPEVPSRGPATGNDSLVALLQALLRLRCEKHGVAMKMVATRVDLDRIATESNPKIRVLKGWRREIFGADALALRDGRLALTGNGDGVTDLIIGDEA
ncbi:MAG: ribonuclease D [Rhodobacterales bacterium]|nr:ribonuclease D [Rhodobacterales bacterium]